MGKAAKVQQAAAPAPSYGSIEGPWWDDKPVAIVGGGPSLQGFDFGRLRGAHVLAVKGTIFDMPWADACFGLDMPRFKEWKKKFASMEARIYWACPPEQMHEHGDITPNITLLKRLEGQGISEASSEIYGGGTSGFGALQIACHKRAKDIVLFGYDYDGNYGPSDSIGQFRHNDQHYERKRAQNASNWFMWANYFAGYVPWLNDHGISVVNACPQSQINCFQKMTLDDGVKWLHRGDDVQK